MKYFKALFLFFGLVCLNASCTKTYTCKCFTSGKTYDITSDSQAAADGECQTYESDPFNGNCELI